MMLNYKNKPDFQLEKLASNLDFNKYNVINPKVDKIYVNKKCQLSSALFLSQKLSLIVGTIP